MRPYAIGLDIGITSVGWAAVALDANEKPCGIINMGSRIFDAAEHPKTGASLAQPRREARSSRRRLRRHRHRNERIRYLIENTLLDRDALTHLYDGEIGDVYELRVKALDQAVSKEELARIMIHLSQRRGFKSNRKNGSGDEDGKILAAVIANTERMEAHGYRTVGEMICKDEVFAEHKRNKGGEYLSTVTRDMVESEVHTIFARQRALGADYASEALETAYLGILLGQRSFDEGPGGNSKYGGNQIDKMIGKCTFFPEEQRAAKATYSFECFSLLEKINHIRLVSAQETIALSEEQRNTVREMALKSEKVTFLQIRNKLAIPATYKFNSVRYENAVKAEDSEKKTVLLPMKAYHQIRKTYDRIGADFAAVTNEQLNTIGTVLSKYKNSETIAKLLTGAGIEESLIEELQKLSFAKFGHISVKACDALIPYLERGMNYNDACAAAGIDFRAHGGAEKTVLLKPTQEDFEDITSPVVKRAVSQTIKVINALIREYGSPVFINIELAREMSKDFADRKKAEKEIETNRTANERLVNEIKELFHVSRPTGQDIVKYRLYKEQDGICAYSLKHFAIERLFEPGYAEVDHIVPYSISFDDSRKNKVLVFASENRQKGNRLPLQYLSGEKRDNFIVWTKANVRDYRKRELLLKESVDEEGFKERNLQDTKYISSFMANYIRDHLAFAPSTTGKIKRVTAVNGAVTAYMRKRWGITKIREDGDLHHAVDALVVVCTTDGQIQKVSKYSRYRECKYLEHEGGSVMYNEADGEVLTEFPVPWAVFRKELEARLGNNPQRLVADLKLPFYNRMDAPKVRPLFVSRMPKHKVTGAAHKDTVKSARHAEEGIAVVKRALADLKLTKDGEIQNYYNPGDDPLLYEALKARLAAFGGDGKKAFAEPFHKPKKDGTPGPVVNKVKLTEPTTLNVQVQDGTGIADNDSMVRIDVFKVEGEGYYFVPVYIADTKKATLPNKAVVGGKPFAKWKTMEDKDFVFSLYPNDLIRVSREKEIVLNKVFSAGTLPDKMSCREALLYYVMSDIATGAITCINHDNTYRARGLGIKTLSCFEKYTVDVLGNYHKVEREKRLGFENMKR